MGSCTSTLHEVEYKHGKATGYKYAGPGGHKYLTRRAKIKQRVNKKPRARTYR